MVVLFAAALLLGLLYAVVLFYYRRSWRRLASYQPRPGTEAEIRFSVIIPARNEAAAIGALLNSLMAQNYPKAFWEMIVVDDHSTDATAAIVEQFEGVQLIRLTADRINSYKKKAIETGIAAARHEWIVCTDGDCIAGTDWLSTLAAFITEHRPVFVAAPVRLVQERHRPLSIFQVLDFLTLQGITAAAVHSGQHSMCNGANLAYRREVFYEVDGFRGIDRIASGDDMLLMHKIRKRYPDKVRYLKSPKAIIDTAVMPNWKAFMNQRIRWASKATSYDDKRIFGVLLLVYLFNVLFLVLAVASFFNLIYLYGLLALILLKTLIELPFVLSVSRFFQARQLMKYFLFFQPLHIVYTILSGFLGSFGKYEWKGRKVR